MIPVIKQMEEIVSNYPGKRLLDLGFGSGRHSLFFSRMGLNVVAVDKSMQNVDELKAKCKEFNRDINIIHSDILDLDFDVLGEFDVIHCMNVLHFLEKEDAHIFIGKMKSHTKNDGINIISVFTSFGELSGLKFFERGELKKLYHDWDILNYEEFNGKTMETRENGTPKMHEVALIISKKN